MTGTIYIASKGVASSLDPVQHLYLLYSPTSDLSDTDHLQIIRGGDRYGAGSSSTDLVIEIAPIIQESQDRYNSGEDYTTRGTVALDIGTRDAATVWGQLEATAASLGDSGSTISYPYTDGGIVHDTGLIYEATVFGGATHNSNATIESILAANNILLSDNLPSNVDALHPIPGEDTIFAGAGNDTLLIGSNVEYINGNGGTDTADFSDVLSSTGIVVDLHAGTFVHSSMSNGEIYNVENVTGTVYNDTLIGNSDHNILHGGLGNDILVYNYTNQYSTSARDQYYGDDDFNTVKFQFTTAQLSNAIRDEILQLNHDIVHDATPTDGIDHTFTNLNLDVHSIESVMVQQDGQAVSLVSQANDDDFRIDVGTTGFTGNVLTDNGHGADYTFGSALTVTNGTYTTDQGGSITLNSDGSFSYTPTSTSYEGEDTYTYTITDTAGDTSTAVLHLNVNEVQNGTSGDDNINFSVGHGGNGYGGDGNDIIIGTIYSDYLEGGAGNDNIGGNGGNDIIIGGAGNDDLEAGIGYSFIYGGDGNDTIGGSSGGGYIDAGSGNDIVTTGTGNSIVYLGAGDDVLYNQYGGNSIIHGGGGSDTIHLGDGNNVVYADTGMINVYPGNGNDTIYGGNGADGAILGSGNNYFDGGAGNDGVEIGTGTNIVLGGDGDDYFALGQSHSYVDGGTGSNEIEFTGNSGTDTGVIFNINDSSNNLIDGWSDTQTVIHVQTVIGTVYNDIFTAADRAVSINAEDGDDVINYTSSASVTDESTLIGGGQNDTLNLHVTSAELNDATREQIAHYDQYQQGAADGVPYNSAAIFDISGLHLSIDRFDHFNLYVDGVSTVINVTAKDDAFEGLINHTQTGNVLVDNGHGADTGFAHDLGVVADHLTSVNGSTLDIYSDGSFSYSPTHDFSGIDTFDYTLQDSWGHTDTGHMTFSVGSIVGTEGADAISTTSTDDFVYAGGGDDTIYGSNGNDTIDGGDGHNTVDYSGVMTSPYGFLEVDLTASTVTAFKEFVGTDHLTHIDSIIAGAGSDYLNGDAHDNYFDGRGGDDYLYGNDGNDTIYGGDGNDTVDGGSGDNYLDGGDGDNNFYALNGNNTIYATDGNNTVTVGDGHNVIHLGDGANSITVGAGNNEIHAGSGGNTITTGDGDNTIYTHDGNDYITVGIGNNVIHSGSGDDIVYGGHGTVYGGAGDDDIELGDSGNTIHGGSGDDYISSGSGDDVLDGGSGSNYIIGGAGADTFVFTAHSMDGNLTTIADFNPSGDNDVLNLKDLLTGYTPGTSDINNFVHLTTSGSDMILSVDTAGTGASYQNIATLQGVSGLNVDDLLNHSHLMVTA